MVRARRKVMQVQALWRYLAETPHTHSKPLRWLERAANCVVLMGHMGRIRPIGHTGPIGPMKQARKKRRGRFRYLLPRSDSPRNTDWVKASRCWKLSQKVV
ncbi:MAG: hypothetical protein RLZZ458_3776 [Planctomycetota bacterium]